jgi:hypothetical protein
LIFMGPNKVLTLEVFLEVKLCIWSSTSATNLLSSSILFI